MYNKNNLLPIKIASKHSIKPELQSVAFYGNRTVATDSFRLLEVSADGDAHEPILYSANMLKAMKLKKGETFTEDDIPLKPISAQYPEIDVLFDRDKDVEYTEIKVNGRFLGEMLMLMAKCNTTEGVILRVPHTAYRAIQLNAENKDQKMRGLVMPHNR